MKKIASIIAVVLFSLMLITCLSTAANSNIKVASDPGFNVIKVKQGTTFDKTKYDSAPVSQAVTRGAVPRSYSLKEYAPIPGNQGSIGSCFAWASAYSARSIIESQKLNSKDKMLNTKMAYSPLYLYFAVREYFKMPDDADGASLMNTFEVMAGIGLPNRLIFDENIVSNIMITDKQRPYSNPIDGFGILFTSNANASYRVDQVKKSLTANNPVIIGFNVPKTFMSAKDQWIPGSSEKPGDGFGHALCVIGFDDLKYGGAFEVMNSWGEEWGSEGCTWISYDTFGKWVDQAWVITLDDSIYDNAVGLTAQANIQLGGKNENAKVKLLNDGVYSLPSTVKNGTQVRIITNNTPSVRNTKINTYVFYTNSDYTKALKANAGEWINVDASFKDANFVILYSRLEINMDSFISNFNKQKGDISARLTGILGKDLVLFDNCSYDYSSMKMSANMMDQKAVAGMVISVKYDTEEKLINDMVFVKGGTFTMGSPSSEAGRFDYEAQRKITLKDFYIGAAEVTVGGFKEFIQATNYRTTAEKNGKSALLTIDGDMEERRGINWKNAGFTQEDTHPVVHITLIDAMEYCNWKSKQEGLSPVYNISANNFTVDEAKNGYRLPTEAEWEYACRAGTTTPYNTGKSISPNQANYNNSMIYKTTPVRKYSPNKWGIYDMHGNIFELCIDLLDEDLFAIKGGTWISNQTGVRSAFKFAQSAGESTVFTGMRLARNAN